MKKYVKPELFYERYELSQHIADCAYQYELEGFQDPKICIATIDPDLTHSQYAGAVIFVNDNNNCAVKVQDYCYQTGADAIKTFVS